MSELKKAVLHYYPTLCNIFRYHAAVGGSGSAAQMQLNKWTVVLSQSKLIDDACKQSNSAACDTIFIVSNLVADRKAHESKFNLERALCRFEFIEALLRLSIGKYRKAVPPWS